MTDKFDVLKQTGVSESNFTEYPKNHHKIGEGETNSFSEIITRLVMGKSLSKSDMNSTENKKSTIDPTTVDSANNNNKNTNTNNQTSIRSKSPDKIHRVDSLYSTSDNHTAPSQHQSYSGMPKRSCRAPPSKKFAHPCTCGHSNHNAFLVTLSNFKDYNNTNNGSNIMSHGQPLPQVAYTSPLQLYDPVSKKCLPTSRNRDMLLKECHINNNNISSHNSDYIYNPNSNLDDNNNNNKLFVSSHHNEKYSCVYDDLICDTRKLRCVCKPSLHLYYGANNSTFACVPLATSQSSPDGRINCRSNYVYNVQSKECQKVFDINDLQFSPKTVSATQLSFVTIVLIWILLLILIVTAKFRKLRTTNLYRNSPAERRSHHNRNMPISSRHHHGSAQRSTWLRPIIAAVNGHHQLFYQHRNTIDRFTQSMTIDESGNNSNDTDFFLSNGPNNNNRNRFLNDPNVAGSQLSLSNPPPKFEEIYPSCTLPINSNINATDCGQDAVNDEPDGQIRPPSNEDLPSYDEAMKLQNTIPPDLKE